MAREIPSSAEVERGDRPAATTDANVAVVIVNYRTPQLTIACLASLRAEKRQMPKLRVIVVDGGSADDSAEQICAAARGPEYRDWVSVLPLAINGGFGWANNQAILKLAREDRSPEYIHLLNPDAQVVEDAVGALIGEMQDHPECGAAGSLVLRPGGKPAASAFRFPSPGRELINAAGSERLGRLLGISPTVMAPGQSTAVDWVSGASVLLRVDALRAAGLFDDGFFLYFEEVELMHRLRQNGWTTRHVPDSRVVHIEGASTGVGVSAPVLPPYWFESRERYFALTGGSRALAAANLARRAGGTIRKVKDLGRAGQAERTAVKPFKPAVPSFSKWGDELGKPPAWMADR